MKLEDAGDCELYRYMLMDNADREAARFSFEELQALLPEIVRVIVVARAGGRDAG